MFSEPFIPVQIWRNTKLASEVGFVLPSGNWLEKPCPNDHSSSNVLMIEKQLIISQVVRQSLKSRDGYGVIDGVAGNWMGCKTGNDHFCSGVDI